MEHVMTFKILPVVLLSIPLLLSGCLDEDDDDKDPDADSGWTAQATGISDNDYRLVSKPTTVDEINNGLTPTCVAITAQYDSSEDDSKAVSLTFDADGVAGSLVVTTFLGDTTCASGNLTAGDFSDIAYFDHVLSSKGDFAFNRFDITITGLAKKAITSSGADALNAADSDAGSCGESNWAVDTELDITADITVCTGGLDLVNGFQLSDAQAHFGGAAMPLADGTVLEGVQTWAGSMLSLAFGAQGSRPANVTTTRITNDANDYYDFIDGGVTFSQ